MVEKNRLVSLIYIYFYLCFLTMFIRAWDYIGTVITFMMYNCMNNSLLKLQDKRFRVIVNLS